MIFESIEVTLVRLDRVSITFNMVQLILCESIMVELVIVQSIFVELIIVELVTFVSIRVELFIVLLMTVPLLMLLFSSVELMIVLFTFSEPSIVELMIVLCCFVELVILELRTMLLVLVVIGPKSVTNPETKPPLLELYGCWIPESPNSSKLSSKMFNSSMSSHRFPMACTPPFVTLLLLKEFPDVNALANIVAL